MRDLNCCMPRKGIPGVMASRSLLGGPTQYKVNEHTDVHRRSLNPDAPRSPVIAV